MDLKLFLCSHSVVIPDDRILSSGIILDKRVLFLISQVLYLMTELNIRKSVKKYLDYMFPFGFTYIIITKYNSSY